MYNDPTTVTLCRVCNNKLARLTCHSPRNTMDQCCFSMNIEVLDAPHCQLTFHLANPCLLNIHGIEPGRVLLLKDAHNVTLVLCKDILCSCLCGSTCGVGSFQGWSHASHILITCSLVPSPLPGAIFNVTTMIKWRREWAGDETNCMPFTLKNRMQVTPYSDVGHAQVTVFQHKPSELQLSSASLLETDAHSCNFSATSYPEYT